MSDVLPTTPEKVVDQLIEKITGTSEFEGVTVLPFRRGDPFQKLQQTVAELAPVCVSVTILRIRPKYTQSHRPFYDPAIFALDFVENMLDLDTTIPSSWDLALAADKTLKNWKGPWGYDCMVLNDDIVEIDPSDTQSELLRIVRVPITTKFAGMPRATTN